MCKWLFEWIAWRSRRWPLWLQPGIDPSHKSHNALDKYPIVRHFVTEMCTHAFLLQNDAMLYTGMMHCGICATLLLGVTSARVVFFFYTNWTGQGVCIHCYCHQNAIERETNPRDRKIRQYGWLVHFLEIILAKAAPSTGNFMCCRARIHGDT